MSVAVLISGSLFKVPEQRTSSSGRKYVTTTLKTSSADNSGSDFWSVLSFGTTTSEELMRLAVGERCSIQGALKIELFTGASDGKTKISRTIFVDSVLALRQPPKERKAKAAAAPTSQDQSTTATTTSATAGLGDEIPF